MPTLGRSITRVPVRKSSKSVKLLFREIPTTSFDSFFVYVLSYSGTFASSSVDLGVRVKS